MKKVPGYIAVCLAGFVAYGVLDRIMRAKAEESFQLERTQCVAILIDHWKRHEGNQGEEVGGDHPYILVDWSKLTAGQGASQGKYPLMYDGRMSNHDGRGVNILMVDGSVEWDSNAEWLKKFSIEHPNAKLLMPQ